MSSKHFKLKAGFSSNKTSQDKFYSSSTPEGRYSKEEPARRGKLKNKTP